MKKSALIILTIVTLMSCQQEMITPTANPQVVISSLWQYADENYAYFDYKEIDWDEKRSTYLNLVNSSTSKDSLFSICSAMIAELKDGHNFLNNGEIINRYDYKAGFEINFDLDLVKSKYLRNDFITKGNFTYGIINETIGYVHYKKFSGVSRFQNVMQHFADTDVTKIVFDLRDNSGGSPEAAQEIAGYFVKEPSLIGFITHKNGKDHDDFSAKIEIDAIPQKITFEKNINFIIDRSSFSASSYLVGMMRYFPNVKLIGQQTGGGGGAAAAFELPNGWVVGITSNFFLDSQSQHIENGVMPTIEVTNTEKDLDWQIDKMLERAVAE